MVSLFSSVTHDSWLSWSPLNLHGYYITFSDFGHLGYTSTLVGDLQPQCAPATPGTVVLKRWSLYRRWIMLLSSRPCAILTHPSFSLHLWAVLFDQLHRRDAWSGNQVCLANSSRNLALWQKKQAAFTTLWHRVAKELLSLRFDELQTVQAFLQGIASTLSWLSPGGRTPSNLPWTRNWKSYIRFWGQVYWQTSLPTYTWHNNKLDFPSLLRWLIMGARLCTPASF